MNTRRVMTWMIFWSSVVLALGALAWVTIEVIALEEREATAQVEAYRQESIRRALWRMDSRMAPILAIEASRPFADYKSLEGTRAQWLRNASPGQQSGTLGSNASNLYANSYFEFDQDPEIKAFESIGQITSLLNATHPDQVTDDSDNESFAVSADTINTLDDDMRRDQVANSDFEARKRVAEIATQAVLPEPEIKAGLQSPEKDDGVHAGALMPPSADKLEKRSSFSGNTQLKGAPGESTDSSVQPIDEVDHSIGTLYPKWIADDSGTLQLVLVRSAILGGNPVVQGVWLDWNTLRSDLLESVADVMDGSSLVAVTGPRSSMLGGYQLATIPVEFIPPASDVVISWRWSPAIVGLLVTWIAIIATIIAVGGVLRAAIVLSDRRGKFVTAVTHELRTPLTTFRLYSQMLADGMVSDEDVRKDYLQILKRESERLTGIVENVLEYARLNRQRSSKDKPSGVQTISPGALVARFRPALARRAGQSNLDLVVSMDLESHQNRTVSVDPHAVERIMMNLIENACKYAVSAEVDEMESALDESDTRVHFDISIQGNMLEMLIADHGQGIAPGEGARIFGEFQRGWRGLSNARSGLGLGLALSRGLAREMEGDLVLAKRRGHGAEFLLTIPLDSQVSTES